MDHLATRRGACDAYVMERDFLRIGQRNVRSELTHFKDGEAWAPTDSC